MKYKNINEIETSKCKDKNRIKTKQKGMHKFHRIINKCEYGAVRSCVRTYIQDAYVR